MHPPQTIRPLSTVLRAHPSFTPNIRRSPLLLDNAPFTRIHHLVVCTPKTPLYDLPAIAEPQGAIALVLNSRAQIALLRHWRPVPPTIPGSAQFDDPLSVPHGFYSTELPRGFPQPRESPAATARREVQEELGVSVTSVCQLGWCNFNTAYMLTDLPVFAVLADERVPAADQREESEIIDAVEWVDVDELRERVVAGGIRCALTLAALAYAFADWKRIEAFVKGQK